MLRWGYAWRLRGFGSQRLSRYAQRAGSGCLDVRAWRLVRDQMNGTSTRMLRWGYAWRLRGFGRIALAATRSVRVRVAWCVVALRWRWSKTIGASPRMLRWGYAWRLKCRSLRYSNLGVGRWIRERHPEVSVGSTQFRSRIARDIGTCTNRVCND